MNPQQLHDFIIKPALQYMGGSYYSKESAFLLLTTSAIESNCGEYIKQINGPALGPWQMEPSTHDDIFSNCDAMQDVNSDISKVKYSILSLSPTYNADEDFEAVHSNLIDSPKYACAMARLKYSMDPNPLPKLTGDNDVDSRAFFCYYKRVYNTELGASTYDKWCTAIAANHILKVKL